MPGNKAGEGGGNPPPRQPVGVAWPADPTDPARLMSTTAFAKELLAGCIERVDAAGARDAAALRAEQQYRQHYNEHFINHTRACASSPAAALAVARAGLHGIYDAFRFFRPAAATAATGGAAAPPAVLLRDAMATPALGTFRTVVVHGPSATGGGGGAATSPPLRLQVPFQGKTLSGAALARRAAAWVEKGVIEPSAGAAVAALLADAPSPAQLASHAFVVMGAGAAMGPAEPLLRLGATVVALDLAGRPAVWRRLVAVARGSPGARLIVPVRQGGGSSDGTGNGDVTDAALCEAAGCNLLTDTPEIAAWLASLLPAVASLPSAPAVAAPPLGLQTMSVGQYAYLDGARFVTICVAMDAVAAEVQRRCGVAAVGMAYLATPTDIYARPAAARDAAKDRWAARPLWMRLPGMPLKENTTGRGIVCGGGGGGGGGGGSGGGGFDIVDCTVHEQGPNYLLAKRVQQWRAMLARAEGAVVSSNVAPASFTVSVTKAALLSAAFAGTQSFPPVEIFDPDTSNTVMTAALLYDVFNPRSAAHPGTPLENPVCLWAENAWHGGMWRCSIYVRTCVVPAAAIGLVKQYAAPLAAVATAAVGGAAYAALRPRARL